jgi:hypothetical protein
MRILITGSRNWTDRQTLCQVLLDLCWDLDKSVPVIVHGAAPGADSLAAWWANATGRKSEAHPADWERACDNNCHHKPRTKNGKPYCPMAGHLRNQKMVDLGADICLAFPMPGSRGTWDCVRRAEQAGIPVKIIEGHQP